ncbi:MAG TPA: menaquinone biosynthesis protein [Panacibacter sp.]|nr:menaquinone biosynthesis protein [Panacibacter sp.]
MKKIKVGAVSYLNTKPLLYGIKRSPELLEKIELVEDYPSNIAAMLVNGTIDAGLVPVAIIPRLKEWHIITDYCIGTIGNVASVCLFSELPIEKIDTVLLDYQSNTSVALAKILLKKYWKIEPKLINGGKDFIEHIKGRTAGVVIGDRALAQRKVSPYIYDLAGAWKAMTGLPFVFAAWITNKVLPGEFVKLFNEGNAFGLKNMEAVVSENPFPEFDIRYYYANNISYNLTDDKMQGMNLFLEMLAML